MMKKKIKSDLALQILSVVIAISLWFYVVQVENPEIDRTVRNVPVVFSQVENLEEKGLIFLNENEHTIDVEIRGSRQNVMDVNTKNLTVLADISGINSVGKHTVNTNVVLPYANLQLLNQKPSALTVEVDRLVSVNKPVEVLTKGNPRESYAVGNLTTNQDEITVKGPKTIVDSIHSLAVTVDVSGKTADVIGMAPVVPLDSNEKEIKSSLLVFSKGEVEVHAEILKTKTLPLEVVYADFAHGLQNDYVLDESSVREVRIAGAQANLNVMNSVKTKPISEYNMNESGEITVELDLPMGVRSLDGDSFVLRFNKKIADH